MGFFKKLGKGLLITGAVSGISALAIKNKIETKEAEKEAEKEYEEWERELEEQRAENEKRKSMICEYDEIMTEDIFETIVGNFGENYFDGDLSLNYLEHPRKGDLFISDEVRALEMLEKGRFELSDKEKKDILAFINNINKDMDGTPFKISHRILNETILLYHAKK